jgi:hypothetical protein
VTSPGRRTGLASTVALVRVIVLVALVAGCELLPIGPLAPAAPGLVNPPGVPVAVASAGGPRVVGVVGSYAYRGEGSSAPWLPAIALATLDARAGAVVDRLPVVGWQAQFAPGAAGPEAEPRPLGEGEGLLPGEPIELVAPAAGSWTIGVSIWYPEGSASYYWHVLVR